MNPSGRDVAGFVLAGGRSSRMGVDKALIPFAGLPLVKHALGILRGAGLDTAIAGARSPLLEFAPVIQDDGTGPLSGICAALRATSADLAVFLPIDLPLLPAELVRALAEHALVTHAFVTLASVSGFAETFPAVVDRAILPALEAERSAGNDGCFAGLRAAAVSNGRMFQVVPVEVLTQSGKVAHPKGLPPSIWWTNMNAPNDLKHAEARISRRIA